MFKHFIIYYLSILTIAFGFSLLPTSITQLAEDFKTTPERLDWVFSVMFLGFLIGVGICTFLLDRLGKDRLIFVGLLFVFAALILASLITTLPHFIIPGILLGLGVGLVEIGATACISERSCETNRLQVMNLGQAFFCGGTVLGPLLIGLLLSEGMHWRSIFQLMAFAALGVGVLFAIKADVRKKPVGSVAHPDILGLFRDFGFVLLAIEMFLFVSAEGGYANWSCAYFVETLGSPLWVGGLMLSTFWIGEGSGRLLLAFWRPRATERRIIMWFYLIALAGGAPLIFIKSPWIGFFCLLLTGFGLSVVWPTIVAIAGKNYQGKGSATFSVIIGAGAVGGLCSGPIVGRVTQFTGNFRIGMAMPLIIMLVSLCLFLRKESR